MREEVGGLIWVAGMVVGVKSEGTLESAAGEPAVVGHVIVRASSRSRSEPSGKVSSGDRFRLSAPTALTKRWSKGHGSCGLTRHSTPCAGHVALTWSKGDADGSFAHQDAITDPSPPSSQTYRDSVSPAPYVVTHGD